MKYYTFSIKKYQCYLFKYKLLQVSTLFIGQHIINNNYLYKIMKSLLKKGEKERWRKRERDRNVR